MFLGAFTYSIPWNLVKTRASKMLVTLPILPYNSLLFYLPFRSSTNYPIDMSVSKIEKSRKLMNKRWVMGNGKFGKKMDEYNERF